MNYWIIELSNYRLLNYLNIKLWNYLIRKGFKKLWNFPLGGRLGSAKFPLKKHMLKHSKRILRQTYIFSFLGGWGLFTRTVLLSFKTFSRGNLATTHAPVSYRLRFIACRSFWAIKSFPTKGRRGVRPLLDFSSNFSFIFVTYPNLI